jgi:FkbM family methyltransferase
MERAMMMVEYIKLLHRAWKCRKADKNEIRYLIDHIKKGDTVFDVGAHKGGYTFWMRKAVGPKGLVVAFEPQKKGAALLRRIFDDMVRVEHLALSDKHGGRQLYIQPQSYDVSFEASLDKPYEQAEVENVAATTIDIYCKEHRLSPHFIKIDVEGHEQQVIDGAAVILQQLKPVLLVECEVRHTGWHAMERLFDQLTGYGYHGFFFFDGMQLPLSRFDAVTHQDIAMLQKGRYANNFVFE